MSVNESLVILKDVREFTVEAAEFIVLEVARGASVKELHECHEDLVPSPLVVNRWRKNVPQFDMLMKEAEAAKAQGMADDIIKIADDENRQAAQARNAMEARKWLAGRLSEQFEQKQRGGVTINQTVRLTNAELMAIAAGKFDEQSIPGEVEHVPLPAPDKGDDAVLVQEPVSVPEMEPVSVDEEEVSPEAVGRGWDFL